MTFQGNTEFADRSNRIAQQKAKDWWCKIHPTARWGVNPTTGKHYRQCSTGHKLSVRGITSAHCVIGGEMK